MSFYHNVPIIHGTTMSDSHISFSQLHPIQRCLLVSILIGIGWISPTWAGEGLVTLFDQAQQHDAQLQQAQAQFTADQTLLSQAKAVLLPNVSAQLSYQYNDYSQPVFMAAKESQQQRLQLSQPLFDAAAMARYEQAQSVVAKSEVTLQLAQQGLILRLSKAYFDVLRAAQLESFAKAQQDSTNKQKEQIEAGVNVGLTNPMDLLEVQARTDMAQADVIQAQNQLAVAQAQLARLIDKPTPQLKQMALTTQLPKFTQTAEQLSQAVTHNLQLQQSRYQLESAAKQVEATRAAHYPTVSLQASITNLDAQLSQSSPLIEYPYQTNSIGVQLNVPLYSGGMVSSQVAQAQALQQAAEAGVRFADEQARVDTLTLANTVIMSYTRLQALRQSVKSNESFLQAAEEGNRVGLKNLVDVLNARALLYKAKQDLANALFDDIQNRLSLKAAQGILSRQDLQELEGYLQDE